MGGTDLAKDMGISVDTLVTTHNGHYEAAKKTEKDPDGGSWPAYPSGKSWDEPSGKTGSGKKFYHNIIQGSAVPTEPFYVAIITPVIHYCMGGLEIDVDSQCLDARGKKIPGLYAAGEVAGGVHGNNRLGGNSLLDCVVFGRVAGRHCTQCMNGKIVETSLKDLSGGGLTGAVTSSKLSGGSYEDGMNGAAAGAGGGGGGGGITMEEVAKHTTKGDCWVVVSGQVLDVKWDVIGEIASGKWVDYTISRLMSAERFLVKVRRHVVHKRARTMGFTGLHARWYKVFVRAIVGDEAINASRIMD